MYTLLCVVILERTVCLRNLINIEVSYTVECFHKSICISLFAFLSILTLKWNINMAAMNVSELWTSTWRPWVCQNFEVEHQHGGHDVMWERSILSVCKKEFTLFIPGLGNCPNISGAIGLPIKSPSKLNKTKQRSINVSSTRNLNSQKKKDGGICQQRAKIKLLLLLKYLQQRLLLETV